MALIQFQDGSWIDIPCKGFGISCGDTVQGSYPYRTLEDNISDSRVVEIIRSMDKDEPIVLKEE